MTGAARDGSALPSRSRRIHRGPHLAGTSDCPRSRLRRALCPARGLVQHPGRPGLVDGSSGGLCRGHPAGDGGVRAGQLRRDGPGPLRSREVPACFTSSTTRSRCSIGPSPPAPAVPSPGRGAVPRTATSVTLRRRSAERSKGCGYRRSMSISSSRMPSWASRSTSPPITRKEFGGDGRPERRTRGGRRTCASSRSTWPRLASSTRPGKWAARSWPWSPDSRSTASWWAIRSEMPERRARFADHLRRAGLPG